MRTVDEWKECLVDKSLPFLIDQTAHYIRGHNGSAYDQAVRELIARRTTESIEKENAAGTGRIG